MPDGLWWMHDDISQVNSQSDEHDRATLLLHMQRSKIWAFRHWSNECDLMGTIHIQDFYLSTWLKMKSQIQWPRPNLHIKSNTCSSAM